MYLLEEIRRVFPSQRGTFLSLLATGQQLIAHRVGIAGTASLPKAKRNLGRAADAFDTYGMIG
jgi:hypothetical protein